MSPPADGPGIELSADVPAVAAGLEAAADELADAAGVLRATDPAGYAFGADHDGVPGRLGQELAACWAAALRARAVDLDDAAARVTAVADAVRRTQREYADTDATVARRLGRSR